jgi:hypothetical protein
MKVKRERVVGWEEIPTHRNPNLQACLIPGIVTSQQLEEEYLV